MTSAAVLKFLGIIFCILVTFAEGKEVIVNVTDTGKDSPSCLEGNTNCLTLRYALKSINEHKYNVIINVYYSHHFAPIHDDLVENNNFYGVQNITLFGHPSTEEEFIFITCTTTNHSLEVATGLYFNGSRSIVIQNIAFINFGVLHPTTGNANWTYCPLDDPVCDNLVLPKAVSAIFMYNCTNLVLDHTYFSSNRGSGISLYNVIGVINIKNSTFVDHTIAEEMICSSSKTTPINTNCSPQATGLYVEFTYCPGFTETCSPPDNTNVFRTEYSITNCYFRNNNNFGAYRGITDIPTPMELNDHRHWPFGKGGGVGIVLRVFDLEHFHLTIENNIFTDNRAVYGGGLYLLLRSGYPDHNSYVLQGNDFINNTADYSGGGVCIEIDVQYNTDVTKETLNRGFRNDMSLYTSNFMNNVAYWGGGMSFTAYPLNVTYVQFFVAECEFSGNVYSGGGGAVALLRKEKPERYYIYTASVGFYKCTFRTTKPELAKGISQQILSSSVHSEGIKISFYNITLFEDNCATALRLSDTGATFYDIVTFRSNTGFNGGGVSLSGKSWITLNQHVNVTFDSNTARYGGAIYYDPAPVMNMNMTSSCFVWYQSTPGTIDVPVQDWWATVTFVGNVASLDGDAAYVTDPQQCVWPNQKSLFNSTRVKIFDYSGQATHTSIVSTPSKHLRFQKHNLRYHKQYTPPENSTDYAKYKLMPGESLQLSLVAHDSSGNEVTSTVVSVVCQNVSDYESYNHQNDACNNESRFSIDSFNRQVLSGQVLKQFRVYGPEHDKLLLVFKTNDPIPVTLPLLIEFSQCENGYHYNKDHKSCICLQDHDDDYMPVFCATDTNTSLDIPCIKRGYWYGKLFGDVHAYHFCRNDKCRSDHHAKSCKDYVEYMILPSNSSVCANGLVGPLCTECEDGHTLSYNGYKCVHCSSGTTVGLILLILLYCFTIVIIIVLFLKLNVHISTAGFYGFLYFYSVLQLLLIIPLPTALDAIIGTIRGITSLDFQLLRYTNLCFNDFRTIHYEAIHYVYPITVMVIIFLIIKIDQSGWRRFQFFSGESSIQALCIILLITYTSVSETSLNILLPLKFQILSDNNSETHKYFVLVDPGVNYMHTSRHLPYWLLAMTVEFVLILPFSLLMFCAPWVMRYVNLSKIKPILDEYQNCFHDNYRWFAGVYLIARQIMFLIVAAAQKPELMAYVQQIFCLILLLLTATLHPYRQRILNVIDIFLLSLLTFLSFTATSSNGQQVYSNFTNMRIAVVGIASILPFFVMMLILALTGCKTICFKFFFFKRFPKLQMKPVVSEVIPHDFQSSNSEDTDKFTATTVSPYNSSKVYGNDLPPRFYDEERTCREEKTPLLTNTIVPTVHSENMSDQYPQPSRKYSINNRPCTN